MGLDPAMRREMLGLLPNLRAFATGLTGRPDEGDDLVAKAVLTALEYPARPERGISMRMWLLSAISDLYHADVRRRRSPDTSDDPVWTEVVIPFSKRASSHPPDMRDALAGLTPEQRVSLLLVAGEGLGHEDAARICRTSVDMLRSRVESARSSIATMLGFTARDGFSP